MVDNRVMADLWLETHLRAAKSNTKLQTIQEQEDTFGQASIKSSDPALAAVSRRLTLDNF